MTRGGVDGGGLNVRVAWRRIVTAVVYTGAVLVVAACGQAEQPPPAPVAAATAPTPTPQPTPATTPVVPAATPAPTSTRTPAATATPAPTEAPLALVERATIRIEAQGTFIDPQFGLQQNAAGAGSGFIISPSGLAITANHVVTGAATLNVNVAGRNRPVNARVIGASECSDLALIDLAGDGYPALRLHEGPVAVGTPLFVAGFPLGEPEFAVVSGIVAKSQADGETSWASVDHVIQHDALANPGNSGGPVVATNGDVIGIHYAGRPNANQGFAISVDVLTPVLDQLRDGKNVDWIGINGEALTDGADLSGIWVYSVESGSPADMAGLKPGDFVMELERLTLGTDGTMSAYCDVLRTRGSDSPMQIKVLRTSTNTILEGQLNGRQLKPVEEGPGRVTGPNVPDAGELVLGAPASGTIELGGTQTWTFNGQAGVHIQIDATGFDTFLRLFDPSGDLVREDDDGHPDDVFGSRLFALLPVTGTYSVEVSGVGEAGDYQVTLSDSAAIDQGHLAAGVEGLSHLDAGRVDLWTLELNAGDPLRIETRGFDTVLAVYGPSLRLLAEDDDGGVDGGSLVELSGVEGGAYRIEVRGFSDATGDYRIGFGSPLAGTDGVAYVDVADDTGTVTATVPDGWAIRSGGNDSTPIIMAAPDLDTFVASLREPKTAQAPGLLVVVLPPPDGTTPVTMAGLESALALEKIPTDCTFDEQIPFNGPPFDGIAKLSRCDGDARHGVWVATPTDRPEALVGLEVIALDGQQWDMALKFVGSIGVDLAKLAPAAESGAAYLQIAADTGQVRADVPAAWQASTDTDSGDVATVHAAPDIAAWHAMLLEPELRLDVSGMTISLLESAPLTADGLVAVADGIATALAPEGCEPGAAPAVRSDAINGRLVSFDCADGVTLMFGAMFADSAPDTLGLVVGIARTDTEIRHVLRFWNTLDIQV